MLPCCHSIAGCHVIMMPSRHVMLDLSCCHLVMLSCCHLVMSCHVAIMVPCQLIIYRHLGLTLLEIWNMKRPAAKPLRRPAAVAKAKSARAPRGASSLAGEGAQLARASKHDKEWCNKSNIYIHESWLFLSTGPQRRCCLHVVWGDVGTTMVPIFGRAGGEQEPHLGNGGKGLFCCQHKSWINTSNVRYVAVHANFGVWGFMHAHVWGQSIGLMQDMLVFNVWSDCAGMSSETLALKSLGLDVCLAEVCQDYFPML